MTNEIEVFGKMNDAEISRADVIALKQEFAKSLKVTADSLVYMSKIWSELNQRGVDLSAIRGGGLIEYIPLIASNQLDARLVVEYAGNKTLLSSLSRLTIEQQKQIIEKQAVTIVTLGDDNEKIESERKLEQLKSTEIFQVFDPNFGVRNPQAQYELLLLRSGVKKNKGSKKPMGRAISKVEVDGDTLIAGKNRINIKAILQALSDATGKNYIEL